MSFSLRFIAIAIINFTISLYSRIADSNLEYNGNNTNDPIAVCLCFTYAENDLVVWFRNIVNALKASLLLFKMDAILISKTLQISGRR